MKFELPPFVKEHPALVVGGVIVAGLGVALVFSAITGKGAAPAASSSGSSSQDTGALLAYQESQNANAAAAAAQTSNQNYQIAALTEQDQTTLAVDTLQAQVTNNQNADNYKLGLAALTDQLAGLINTNQTTVSVATVAANENEAIAATNANVAITQSNNLTQLGIVQANDIAQEQETVSNNAASSSMFGGLFGLLGGIL